MNTRSGDLNTRSGDLNTRSGDMNTRSGGVSTEFIDPQNHWDQPVDILCQLAGPS